MFTRSETIRMFKRLNLSFCHRLSTLLTSPPEGQLFFGISRVKHCKFVTQPDLAPWKTIVSPKITGGYMEVHI